MPSSLRGRRVAVVVATLTALLVGLAASPVSHAAGALDAHAVKKLADKEIKKKAKKLTVAHALDADALGGIPASGFARAGTELLSQSPVGWVPTTGVPLTVTHNDPGTTFTFASTAGLVFTYPLAVPTQVGGTPVTVVSVRYCYVASAGAHLTSASVRQMTFTNGPGSSVGPDAAESVDLANSGCRTITFNRVLGPNDGVDLFVTATWNTGNATLTLGQVSVAYITH